MTGLLAKNDFDTHYSDQLDVWTKEWEEFKINILSKI
jgi:hypothetical protein